MWVQSVDLAGQRVEGVKATALHMGRMDVVGALWTEDWMKPQEASALVSGHSSQEPGEGQAAPLPESSEVAKVAVVCSGVLGGFLLWGPIGGFTRSGEVGQEARAAGCGLRDEGRKSRAGFSG